MISYIVYMILLCISPSGNHIYELKLSDDNRRFFLNRIMVEVRTIYISDRYTPI